MSNSRRPRCDLREPQSYETQIEEKSPRHFSRIGDCITAVLDQRPKLSNIIIQKGLAFIGDWSGTVVKPGHCECPGIPPRRLWAESGLRWCGATAP
jgi:hypothetical protein